MEGNSNITKCFDTDCANILPVITSPSLKQTSKNRLPKGKLKRRGTWQTSNKKWEEISEVFSKPCQASKIRLFSKKNNVSYFRKKLYLCCLTGFSSLLTALPDVLKEAAAQKFINVQVKILEGRPFLVELELVNCSLQFY